MKPKRIDCPYCGSDELKHHAKGFYCCYGCGKTVNPYLLNEYTRLKLKHHAI